jgi:hypothetical protein
MRELAGTQRPAEPFADDARRVVHGLRGALRDVIERASSTPNLRASQLADALDLDRHLAWKISKVIGLQDPFAASQFVPGRGGIRILLAAARRHRVPEDVVEAAGAAFEEFRRVMKSHAGDRQTFNAMLAGHTTRSEARADLEHRKGAFQHNSYIWGVQARTHLSSFILRASEIRPGYYDSVTLRGFIDLRWIRPDVSWRIRRMCAVDDYGRVCADFQRHALSPLTAAESGGAEVPLLREFCSQPVPKLRAPDGAPANTSYQLVEGSVGNSGSLTCLLGEIGRGVEPYTGGEKYARLVLATEVRTPAETLVFDLIVHRGMLGRLNPTAHMFGDLFDRGFNDPPVEADRLPLAEQVEYLGSGADALSTPEVPRYPEMVRFAFDRVGWPESEFDVYRLRIAYPPIPSTVWIAQALPETPQHRSTA